MKVLKPAEATQILSSAASMALSKEGEDGERKETSFSSPLCEFLEQLEETDKTLISFSASVLDGEQ